MAMRSTEAGSLAGDAGSLEELTGGIAHGLGVAAAAGVVVALVN